MPTDSHESEELTAPKRAIIARWRDEGYLETGYVRADVAGGYLVTHGESEDATDERMKELPMYKYMQLECTEIRNML